MHKAEGNLSTFAPSGLWTGEGGKNKGTKQLNVHEEWLFLTPTLPLQGRNPSELQKKCETVWGEIKE